MYHLFALETVKWNTEALPPVCKWIQTHEDIPIQIHKTGAGKTWVHLYKDP